MKWCITVLTFCASLSAAPPVSHSWPPRAYLLKSLIESVPDLLDSYHPETGKFGSEPWVYQDQMAIYPLAAAWSLQDDDNPYYQDSDLIAIIARGGDVWYEQQNDDGTWRLLRKNGDDWGTFRSSYVASHWAATYSLVKDELPAESRAVWETGLRRCLEPVPAMLSSGKVHNQPLRHALALYIGGICFDNKEWREAAAVYMGRVVEEQHPAGYWAEHAGPASAYSMAYPWFLGLYYHFSGDDIVLDALERASRFHLLTRWPDGSLIACIDDRTLYRKYVPPGDVGFSFSPQGRALLLAQLKKSTRAMRNPAPAEYAANMLLFGGQGPIAQLPEESADTIITIGDDDAAVGHRAPWHWAVSAYTAELSSSRWFQDRQNLIDVFHDDLGLVAGGGNTKLQPYWSTFTVGDPESVRFTLGDPRPTFVPKTELNWVPDAVDLSVREGTVVAGVTSAGIVCRATVGVDSEGCFRLTFSAPAGKGVEAHLPLMRRGGQLELGDGATLHLGEDELRLKREQTGSQVVLDGLRISMPDHASLRWPARQYNPYKKNGASSLSNAKLVLVMPFEIVETFTVTLGIAGE